MHILIGVLLLATAISQNSISLESSVTGRGLASTASVNTLDNKISALTAIIEALGTQLGRVTECSANSMFYQPDSPQADANGCVAPASSSISRFVVFDTPGSHSYTKPAGLSKIKVTIIGGGGGGGAGSTSAGGGGAGGVAIKIIEAEDLATTELITVGDAGAGYTGQLKDGGDGGTSSFGSHAYATGGKGGKYGSGNPPNGGDGGMGFNGDINLQGNGGDGGRYNEGFTSAAQGGSSILGGATIGYGTWVSNIPASKHGSGGSGNGWGGASIWATYGGPGVVIIEEYK